MDISGIMGPQEEESLAWLSSKVYFESLILMVWGALRWVSLSFGPSRIDHSRVSLHLDQATSECCGWLGDPQWHVASCT